MTDEQKEALRDFLLYEDGYHALVRRGELLAMHRPDDPTLLPLSAAIADMGEAADNALAVLLKALGA